MTEVRTEAPAQLPAAPPFPTRCPARPMPTPRQGLPSLLPGDPAGLPLDPDSPASLSPPVRSSQGVHSGTRSADPS